MSYICCLPLELFHGCYDQVCYFIPEMTRGHYLQAADPPTWSYLAMEDLILIGHPKGLFKAFGFVTSWLTPGVLP